MGRWSGQGKNGTGGSRPRERREVFESFVPIGPVASQVRLVRALLAKRLEPGERVMAGSMLRRAVEQPLTEKQAAWLERTAKAYGAVDEGPEVASAKPVGCVGVESWGVLPRKPPGKL